MEPLAPCPCFFVIAQMQESQERECSVAQPTISVVPVPCAPRALRKRRCGCGNYRTGRSISQRLQGDERTLDSIRPRPNARTSITPFAPKCLRAFERLYRIDRLRRTLERAPIGQHKGHRL